VMVLSWDFDYTDDQGRDVTTRTSQELLREVTYPIAMHDLINSGLKSNDKLTSNLFTVQDFGQPKPEPMEITSEEVKQSRILKINSGYGFIQYPPNNLFFHYIDVADGDFDELIEGDMVEFIVAKNDKGQDVAKNVKKIPDYDVNQW